MRARRPALSLAAVALLVGGAAVALGLVLTGPGPRDRTPGASPAAARTRGDAALAALPAPRASFAVPRPRLLGDGSVVARWAPVLVATEARAAPSAASPAVVRVGTRTPEGTSNLVLADGEVTRGGVTWVHARLAVLPDRRTGWIPRQDLGGWTFVDTHAVVDRARLTFTLYRAGRVIFRAPVGVGKPGTPTPAGQFYIRDRLTRYASAEYGPIAFGTSARSAEETDWPAGGFIGVHGTDQPGLIPGRISHGCIRLTNSAIERLAALMPVGTPVTIR